MEQAVPKTAKYYENRMTYSDAIQEIIKVISVFIDYIKKKIPAC